MSTIQMIKSGVDEAIHLFGVMNKFSVPCSLELKLSEWSDPLVSIVGESVRIEYIEGNEGDSLVVILGESEFCFNLNISVSKYITDFQITMCIANDEYSAWFSSGVISQKGIAEANDYKEYEEVNDFELGIGTEHELRLVEFIRTLDFDDVLDATTAINKEAEFAETKSSRCLPYAVKGFKERVSRLKQLSLLLGMAINDYRSEVFLGEDGNETKVD
ncbi:hypothetical protein ACP8HI_04345 [Paenibacillus sp. FA6]|uniref:hypothetical protein n=1 Tax=Paenibacillus sp. FA6 TaxID=3413029 RepID=UPI003F65BAB6